MVLADEAERDPTKALQPPKKRCRTEYLVFIHLEISLAKIPCSIAAKEPTKLPNLDAASNSSDIGWKSLELSNNGIFRAHRYALPG